MPSKRKPDSQNENQKCSKKGRKKQIQSQVNKLSFFPLKAISKLLPTDDEFVFVTDLGEKLKHIVPVSKEMNESNRTNEEEHKRLIEQMELISIDNTVTEQVKMAKITELSALAKEVLSDINEHREYEKEVNHNRNKV